MIERGDRNGVIYTDENWQIRWHEIDGHIPWYTLHQRKKFLFISWWSNAIEMSPDVDKLKRYIDRKNQWPIEVFSLMEWPIEPHNKYEDIDDDKPDT